MAGSITILAEREISSTLVSTLKSRLRMKCPSCGHWNRVPANKIFIQQTSPIDPSKVKVMIPMYQPLQVSKCKCGRTIAEPKELIRIVKQK